MSERRQSQTEGFRVGDAYMRPTFHEPVGSHIAWGGPEVEHATYKPAIPLPVGQTLLLTLTNHRALRRATPTKQPLPSLLSRK